MKKIINRPDVAVIVLTHDAGNGWEAWLDALMSQTVRAGRYFLVDSSSMDGTALKAAKAGFDVCSINPAHFDQGATRQLAAEQCSDFDFLVYVAQNVTFASDNAIELLLSGFDDHCIAMTHGRYSSGALSHTIGNYEDLLVFPPVSCVKTVLTMGKGGAFNVQASNTFAAYRTSALIGVGGFPSKVIVGEASYVEMRLLKAGWSVRYEANALIKRKIDGNLFRFWQDSFDWGVFHAEHAAVIGQLDGGVFESRKRLAKLFFFALRYEWKNIPVMIVKMIGQWLAFHLGRWSCALPTVVCRLFSAQKSFWGKGEVMSEVWYWLPGQDNHLV